MRRFQFSTNSKDSFHTGARELSTTDVRATSLPSYITFTASNTDELIRPGALHDWYNKPQGNYDDWRQTTAKQSHETKEELNQSRTHDRHALTPSCTIRRNKTRPLQKSWPYAYECDWWAQAIRIDGTAGAVWKTPPSDDAKQKKMLIA